MPRRSSNALIAALALLALVMLTVWFLPAPATTHDAGGKTRPQTAQTKAKASPVLPTAPQPVAPSEASAQPRPAPVLNGGKTVMQVYRLALRGGVISLDAADRVEGDFHRRRGPMTWLPGMWCVRVLDASQRALAQETSAAPDEPCVVLDPNVAKSSGQPQAARLKLTDDVMTQVRMPATPGAKWVKIYRLAGSQPAALDVEPLGQLLATLPIP